MRSNGGRPPTAGRGTDRLAGRGRGLTRDTGLRSFDYEKKRRSNMANMNKMKEDLEGMQRQFKRASLGPTDPKLGTSALQNPPSDVTSNDNRSSEKARNLTRENDKLEKENADLHDKVQTITLESKDHLQHVVQLQQQLIDLQNKQQSTCQELEVWKKKYRVRQKESFLLIQSMAKKFKEQVAAHTEEGKKLNSSANEVIHWKEKNSHMMQLYDELTERVGALSDENGKLLEHCEQLEEREVHYKEQMSVLEQMQEDYDAMHASMEESMKLASGMKTKMAFFVMDHNRQMVEYEEKLAAQEDELQLMRKEREALNASLDEERRRGSLLKTQFHEAEKFYEKEMSKFTKKK